MDIYIYIYPYGTPYGILLTAPLLFVDIFFYISPIYTYIFLYIFPASDCDNALPSLATYITNHNRECYTLRDFLWDFTRDFIILIIFKRFLVKMGIF